MEEVSMSQMQIYMDKGVQLLMENAPKMILGLLVLFIGLRVLKFLSGLLEKVFEKQKLDVTLRPFLINLIGWTLKAMLFISVASMFGVETTSFVALIGAAGLAIGLALQGTLANFAGGVLLLVFKPYKVGDLIDAQGHFGVVEEIQIFITKLVTPDNKAVIIPNGAISNGSLTNVSEKGFIRVDLVIGISYDSNIKVAKDVLMKVMENHPKVMKDPAPVVAVSELADSSINLVVRPHATVADYWDVRFDILEQGKIALDEANITIPFPQRDVHMINS